MRLGEQSRHWGETWQQKAKYHSQPGGKWLRGAASGGI